MGGMGGIVANKKLDRGGEGRGGGKSGRCMDGYLLRWEGNWAAWYHASSMSTSLNSGSPSLSSLIFRLPY